MSRRSHGGSAGGGKRGTGLTYVRQEPAFLRRMKAATGYREPEQDLEAKRAGPDADEDDAGLDRDDERPAVVALRAGDLTEEEARRAWDKEKADRDAEEEEKPPADGRIMFKRPTKREAGGDEKGAKVDGKTESDAAKKPRREDKDRKKKSAAPPKSKSLLSFDDEEDDDDC